MILLVTGWFDKTDQYGRRTGEKEFLVSHGIDLNTDQTVITSCDPPSRIPGARFDNNYQEWVID